MEFEGNASAEAWRNDLLKRSPTFMYWDLIMRYETLILNFIRAHREKKLPSLCANLGETDTFVLCFGSRELFRWMPVHSKDMKSLPDPIKNEFEKQIHWVLSKTNNAFSSIPFDQFHEQENAYAKGSGGCIGLIENPVVQALDVIKARTGQAAKAI